MITARPLTTIEEWDAFVQKTTYSPMTQAPAYGAFYESMGNNFFVIGVFRDKTLIGGALVIVIRARRGSYFYVPYGPIASANEKYADILEACTTYLKNSAQEYKVSFVRVSPFVEASDEHKTLFAQAGFREAPIHALAETTCVLSLTPDKETILSNMNKNHRNLIRRCEKEGVVIKSYTSAEKLEEFHKLHNITAKRHHFVRFSDEYVEKEFKSFEKNKEAVVFYCYLPDGTLDSSAVVYYYGTTAAYRHGASLGSNNKIPTPYLIQWTAIQEAKKRGKKWYNFWGVAPENAKKSHPFKGITHFKKGFGGEVKNLIECHDLVIDPVRYWPMWVFETLRRIKRGF